MTHTHEPGGSRRRRSDGPEVRLRELLHPVRLGRAMHRRGVRIVILAVLANQPMHGYQVMQELEARSGGRWRPSAGSVYPTLQQLEDEGLVRSEEVDGRRTYTITEDGRTALAESPLGKIPLFDADGKWTKLNVRQDAMGLVGAAIQVSRVGTPEAQEKARDILIDARKRMYRLLADDGTADAGTDPMDGIDQGETA